MSRFSEVVSFYRIVRMAYIALIDNDGRWKIDASTFERQLREDYPVSAFRRITDNARPFTHEWSVDHIPLEGFLHRNGDSVHFDGEFQACVRFALWLRGIVPFSERVLLFDDSGRVSLELRESTTLAEIQGIFSD